MRASLPGDDAEDPLARAYAKVSRQVIPLLLLGYVVAYLDRVNISFAKLQMQHELGFSDATYGLAAGVFFVGYFLFGVPSNLILQRVGARRWLSLLMVCCGLVCGAMMQVRTSASFFTLRFLLGIAEAGFFPGVIYYLTQWYPATRRSAATAVFLSSIACCSVFGSMLSGWIMHRLDGVGGLAGWRWLFLLEAFPAVLVGLAINSRLSNGIDSANWLDEPQKRLLKAELIRDTAARPAGSLGDVFRQRNVWVACLIYFCAMTGLYGITFWLPTLIAEIGVTNIVQIGMLTAIPYCAAAVGMITVGRRADRSGECQRLIALMASLGALGLVLSVRVGAHLWAAIPALSVATLGTFSVPALFWSLPTRFLRETAAAAGIAFINSCGCLAGFLSPYLIGWLKDSTHSTAMGLYWVAGMMLAAAVLVMVALPRNRVEHGV
jgi:MFS family permease